MQAHARDKSDLRQWLASALLAGSVPADLHGVPMADWLDCARREGVVPLLEDRLRHAVAGDALPAGFREALTVAAREALMLDMYRSHELRRVGGVLADANLRVLVLKGNALGLWLYARSQLRVTRDIDLLFASREDVERAVALLARHGYQPEPDPGKFFFERKCKLLVDGASRGELDLHCKLLNTPIFGDVISFDELWQDAMPLPGLPRCVQGLSPVHALVHACLNRALDLAAGEPDPLKLHYDVHLLAARLDAEAWLRFSVLVRERHICGACVRMFSETTQAFGTRFPEPLLAQLRACSLDEPLDWQRLQDWRYMQWRSFLALPHWGDRLHWLYERMFPTPSRVQGRYGDGRRLPLLLRRFRRGLELLFKRTEGQG